MRILITGSNGYLMSHFMEKYEAPPDRVWGLQRSEIFSVNGSLIYCDLSKADHMDQLKNLPIDFDLVIHAAGKVDISLNKNRMNDFPICNANEFSNLYKQNVLSTSNILEMIMCKNIKKLIFLSSQAVYGLPQNTQVIDESTPPNPLEHYALSKVMCENLNNLCASYTALQCINLRVSGVYGGRRQRGLIYNMLDAARNKKSIDLNIDYHLPIDIVHIDDVCNALHGLISSKWENEKAIALNCTSGELTNLALIIEDVFNITGVKHNLIMQNSKILRFENKKLRELQGLEFISRRERIASEWLKLTAH